VVWVVAALADARAGANETEIVDAWPGGPICVCGDAGGGGGGNVPGARQNLTACPTTQGVQRNCTPWRQAARINDGKRETHVRTHAAWGGVGGGVAHQQFCALRSGRLWALWVVEAPLLIHIGRPIPPQFGPAARLIPSDTSDRTATTGKP